MRPVYPNGTAAAAAMLSCHVCGSLLATELKSNHHSQRCKLCHTKLHFRKPYSIQRCLAYLITACILYIPANLLPIMSTTSIGELSENTIVSGVLVLWRDGEYPIALVIFIASVVVPVVKIIAIAFLCWQVGRDQPGSVRRLSKVYEIAELIGKWSMVDVFVVALLVALIQLGSMLTVQPGSAALAFAGVVIFTMLAARAFDPRLIWDKHHDFEAVDAAAITSTGNTQ